MMVDIKNRSFLEDAVILKDALHEGKNILRAAHIETSALEAGVLLCFVLHCDRIFLYTHDRAALREEGIVKYFELIQERANGTPLQYITGRQEFMSLDFVVAPGVLIPRQDTEVLVETVIGHVQGCSGDKDRVNIMDMCTGSGCIAVSLAHFIKNAEVTAVDISGKAIEIASLNASSNKVSDQILFMQSNLFAELKKSSPKVLFDVIVANPPYIPWKEIELLSEEVKDHEPRIALDGGLDGLDFYRVIIEDAVSFLKPSGLLAFEVGYNQSKEVQKLMKEKYHCIGTIKDLSGIERVVTGQLT